MSDVETCYDEEEELLATIAAERGEEDYRDEEDGEE